MENDYGSCWGDRLIQASETAEVAVSARPCAQAGHLELIGQWRVWIGEVEQPSLEQKRCQHYQRIAGCKNQ